MNKSKLLFILLLFLGVAGAVITAIQFITAISFAEYGRVLVYLIIALGMTELSVYSAIKLFRRSKS